MKTPCAVMLSGWGFSSESLQPLRDACGFSPESPMLTATDLWPGLGDASPLSILAGRLAGLPAPRVAVAWSMGALLALELAAEHGELLDGVVLLCATPRFCEGHGFKWGIAAGALRRIMGDFQADPGMALDEFVSLCAAPHGNLNGACEHGRRALQQSGVQAFLWGLQYLLTVDVRERLGAVGMPVLVAQARGDRIVPWRAGRYLAERLPHAELKVFDGVGHDLPVRLPAEVAKAIGPFVSLLT